MKKLLIILLFLVYQAPASELDLRLSSGFNFYHEEASNITINTFSPLAFLTSTYSGELYYNITENFSAGIFIRHGLMDPQVVNPIDYYDFIAGFGAVEILSGPTIMYSIDEFFLSASYALTKNQYETVFQYFWNPYNQYDLIIDEEIFLFSGGGAIDIGKSTDLIIKLEYTYRTLEQYTSAEQTTTEKLSLHRIIPYFGISYKLF